ncbi:MAG: hypothetical protein HN736_09805 [Anaerolineae bacterium]|nr:hypothetical protein [Anaerolineae bacterium]MBT3714320.1 hypothetical protein [Anaerolineae bacterium]MBT4312251.1 hypothetical protein [Anaerolineae bacterium]MBT6060420.1 hypothetical protein [Anaerolineae bacterium]MBT6322014.1 hypothetical protein [Anaerolineae bacterium]
MNENSELPVEFDGDCAFALSVGKRDVEGDKNTYLIRDGEKYLFSNSVAKFLWRIILGQKKKSETNWEMK